jgi:anti-sigma factor ChrR (cupin superfamily)
MSEHLNDEALLDLACGSLTGEDGRLARAHVAACARCAAELELASADRDLLVSVVGPAESEAELPPIDLVLARARARAEQRAGATPRRAAFAVFAAVAMAAAALVFAKTPESGSPPARTATNEVAQDRQGVADFSGMSSARGQSAIAAEKPGECSEPVTVTCSRRVRACSDPETAP